MSQTEAANLQFNAVQTFLIKVGAVLLAGVLFVVASTWFIEFEIQQAVASVDSARIGGLEFWAKVEKKLYEVADAKDLEPEKKARIIVALRKVGQKYGPYYDALWTR